MKVLNPCSIIHEFNDWFNFEMKRTTFKSEEDFAESLFGKFYYLVPGVLK